MPIKKLSAKKKTLHLFWLNFRTVLSVEFHWKIKRTREKSYLVSFFYLINFLKGSSSVSVAVKMKSLINNIIVEIQLFEK